jgi:hypothetical protein
MVSMKVKRKENNAFRIEFSLGLCQTSPIGFYDPYPGRNTHIAVSPDGRTILYPQSDESGSVLMLVDNFR